VQAKAENAPDGHARWSVECDCGKTHTVLGGSLRSGKTISCGCFSHEQTSRRCLYSLTGRRFGRLLVLSRADNDRFGLARWNVTCDCGKKRVIRSADLRSGNSRSCGCYNYEQKLARYGDKSPRWNPKLTQKDRDRRRHGTPASTRFAAVAQKVRRRDRATCLACGDRGTHVHHLEPWAFDRNLRYDPANLVTLCKECHTQFHELYGGDAGLEDFEEYLKP
jgi:5-methylcytosine-specific restriction endonuclease McrA